MFVKNVSAKAFLCAVFFSLSFASQNTAKAISVSTPPVSCNLKSVNEGAGPTIGPARARMSVNFDISPSLARLNSSDAVLLEFTSVLPDFERHTVEFFVDDVFVQRLSKESSSRNWETFRPEPPIDVPTSSTIKVNYKAFGYFADAFDSYQNVECNFIVRGLGTVPILIAM